MKDIAIYGAGGFGREVACLIRIINESLKEPRWRLVGFFDDGVEKGTSIEYGRVLGGIDELNAWNTELDVCFAIGNGSAIEKIVNKVNNPVVCYPNIIHPDVYFFDRATMKFGKGNIISKGCSLTTLITVGDFNLMNGDVTVGHEAVIGNYNTFMPGVRVSGAVNIGNNNFFGVNSVILQQLKIKNNTKLGAGSVLMTNPKEGGLYIGVLAKRTDF